MELLKKLNIETINEELYLKALTHSSYTNETSCENYERLEYLGDAVLELVMTEYLFNEFPNMVEGEMTKIRSQYVCENALYEYSTLLELNNYLRLGKGEILNGGANRKAIVADIFESFIGSMFLDKGLNYVKDFMYKYIMPLIQENKLSFINDYKSKLQEAVQTDKKSVTYVITDESGPAHNKVFNVDVMVNNIIYGSGVGHSKKEAEQEAAKEALSKCAWKRGI